MSKMYTVQTGDTLFSIAFQEGFRSWETIYNDAQNETLWNQRPDGTLVVGDQIFIPDKQPKTVTVQAFSADADPTSKITFVLKSLTLPIQLYLQDEEDEPYSQKKYKVEAEGQTFEGTTDEAGGLSQQLPPTTNTFTVTLWPDETNLQDSRVWEFQLGATEATL